MADAKISGLPSSSGVTPASDYIPIVHNGTTEKITPDQLINGVGLVTTAQLALKANISTLSSTSGATTVGTIQTGTGAVARTVDAKLKETVSVKDFGAVGDGVTDDTVAIQAALNLGISLLVPRGRYCISSGLDFTDGSYLYADNSVFFVQTITNQPAIGEVAELYYTGTGGTNSYMCRLSKTPIGVKPIYTPEEAQTLHGAGIRGLYINGNNLAEFGVYSARAGLGNLYEDITVTKTVKHGMWFGEFWLSNVKNCFALHNLGCGISIGADTFSWSAGNNVNNVNILNPVAYKNGLGLSSWSSATDYLLGYGLGFFFGRSCSAINSDAEYNYGCGIVIQPTSGPNLISETYVENNCYLAASSSDRIQIWYLQGANSYNFILDGLYALFNYITPSGNTNAPTLKITQTSSLGVVNSKNIPEFKNIVGNIVIDSSFAEYNIERYAFSVNNRYLKHYPIYADKDSIIDSSRTIVYVGNAESGNADGTSSSDYTTITKALSIVAVAVNIVTIDFSGLTIVPFATLSLDGININKPITFEGGTTGRFSNNATSFIAANFYRFKFLTTIQNALTIDRCFFYSSNFILNNCPIIRSASNSLADAVLTLDNSTVAISGTSVINLQQSTATIKKGVTLSNNSNLIFTDAVLGTILTNYTPGYAIEFASGGGKVDISNSTATATWGAATNIARTSNGGAKFVVATNGVNQ